MLKQIIMASLEEYAFLSDYLYKGYRTKQN